MLRQEARDPRGVSRRRQHCHPHHPPSRNHVTHPSSRNWYPQWSDIAATSRSPRPPSSCRSPVSRSSGTVSPPASATSTLTLFEEPDTVTPMEPSGPADSLYRTPLVTSSLTNCTATTA